MKPYNLRDTSRRVGTPLVPQRTLLHAQRSTTSSSNVNSIEAANVVRNQIDNIYKNNVDEEHKNAKSDTNDKVHQADLKIENPYERRQVNQAKIHEDQWKKYHSAWQDYYRQYYERYYLNEVHQVKQNLVKQQMPTESPSSNKEAHPDHGGSFSKEEAISELKNNLLNNIQEKATKVRKSRHFIPVALALIVVCIFLFLQYNRVIFANIEAYISPGSIDPANIIVNASSDVTVGPEPRLIIPKINVDVPVDYSSSPDYDSQMKSMENGVAYFGIPGANSKPGEVGNTVLSGHSSNDLFDNGKYKFIFARLEHLTKGDTIYINYKSKRYVYHVTKKEVVNPTDVNKLVYKTNKPVLTLITCTPLGTAKYRLLVTAEQISPDPSSASKKVSSQKDSNIDSSSIPGNSPTFLQRIFGSN